MDYKDACDVLGVCETDPLEYIRSKYKEMLKLIKENSIGNYQYDNNLKYYQNSKINNLLNELYYKSAKGTCYQDNLEKECNFTNTGLTKETISLLDMQTVNNETTSIENKENFKESQITITNTFETNISLPSITDYINTLYCKEENTCNISWMTKPGTLLLTLNDINNNLYTMSITEDGSIKIDNDATTNLEVRPVIVLKEENYIIKGNGTQDTQYKLKKKGGYSHEKKQNNAINAIDYNGSSSKFIYNICSNR